MSYDPGISGISGASDVFLNSPVTGNFLNYNTSTAKWQNSTLAGYAALANGGGAETVFTLSATGVTTLDLANGNIFVATLTSNTTYAFSGATAGKACSFALYNTQNATGGFTVTWPTTVKWSGGAPVLTTMASSVDILVFETIDGGASWYGSLVGTNFT